jgi:hypothetical protein
VSKKPEAAVGPRRRGAAARAAGAGGRSFRLSTSTRGPTCRRCGCGCRTACRFEGRACGWFEVDVCTACAARVLELPHAHVLGLVVAEVAALYGQWKELGIVEPLSAAAMRL